MYNHEPSGYICPFCQLFAGVGTKYNQSQDVVLRNEHVSAFIAPTGWVNNLGHVLVVPNKHYENIYDIPDSELAAVYKNVKKIAIAIRNTYGCEGTSTRQHNEPVGNQDVLHFHVHVFPRYKYDKLYSAHDKRRFVSAEERLPFAEKLRTFLNAGS